MGEALGAGVGIPVGERWRETPDEGTRLPLLQPLPQRAFMNNWRHAGIVVREARPRDLDAIARLENESFETDRVSRRSLRAFLQARTPAGDRGLHRRPACGLCAGLAAQDVPGGAHLLACR